MTSDACDNQHDTDHAILWVRSLQARGLDAEAIRGEIDRWTLDDVTQVYVGAYARTMPTDFVREIVERALGLERLL
jgi:hypothetical protein